MMRDRPVLPDDLMPAARDALAGKRVLVTGATGFIGRRLVQVLLDVGAEVSVILRSGHGAKALTAQNVNVLIGRLSDGPFLARALAEQSVFFHFAYDMRASGPENLDVFNTVLEGVEASGIDRIVHASSMVVYDHWPGDRIDENAAITRTGLEDYRDVKIVMEEALMTGSKAAAILQPGIVHGPGSAMWTDAPRAALRRGAVILPDPPGLCPAIHVDDVTQAAVRAAILPDLARERFILKGPGTLTWGDFYESHRAAIGEGQVKFEPLQALEARLPPAAPPIGTPPAPPLAARISQVLRKIIGRDRFEAIVRGVMRIVSRKGPTYPDRAMLRLYAANAVISDAETQKRLGYKPRIKLGR